jgi:signal recognition particle receptor subunit beta
MRATGTSFGLVRATGLPSEAGGMREREKTPIMVLVNYSGKEINAKVVYYGPGLCGKTTNLEHIYSRVPNTNRGKMVSMKTRTERTLFFDFLPLSLGELGGFQTRFLLYTVPGQVYYNATRKLVLKGVDAIVFVADSGRGKMEENLESLENLRDNLREHGLDLDEIPLVLQYNKRDLSDVYTPEEMEQALNPKGKWPWHEAVATTGEGVFETFKGVGRLLLAHLSKSMGIATTSSPNDALPGPAPAPGSAPAPSIDSGIFSALDPRGKAPAKEPSRPDTAPMPEPVLPESARPAPAPEPQAAPVRADVPMVSDAPPAETPTISPEITPAPTEEPSIVLKAAPPTAAVPPPEAAPPPVIEHPPTRRSASEPVIEHAPAPRFGTGNAEPGMLSLDAGNDTPSDPMSTDPMSVNRPAAETPSVEITAPDPPSVQPPAPSPPPPVELSLVKGSRPGGNAPEEPRVIRVPVVLTAEDVREGVVVELRIEASATTADRVSQAQ